MEPSAPKPRTTAVAEAKGRRPAPRSREREAAALSPLRLRQQARGHNSRQLINNLDVNLDSDDEASHLDLPDPVESDNTDSVSRVLLLALVDLSDDLLAGLASEHWELPHGPVPVLVESRAGEEELVGVGLLLRGELDAWGPAVSDQVVDLLGDVGVRKRRQVRQALVLLLWPEDLHAGHHDWPAGGLGGDLPGLGWPGDDGLAGGRMEQ